MTDTEFAATIAGVLAGPLGDVTVEDLRRLSGGASRETWSFDAVAPDGRSIPLILQRRRGGASFGGPGFPAEDVLLAAAAVAGVPLPEVVADSTACAALGEARITRRLDGETIGRRIVRGEEYSAARALLTGQVASACAAIHSIRPEEVEGLDDSDPLEMIRLGLDALGVVSPAFELAIRWLEDHRPVSPRRTVVHGDLRTGNLLVDPDGLRAVLDWELAHVGDPVEDLGWLCVRAWRFGGEHVVGGFGDTEDLLAEYERAGGGRVDDAHLRWWMVAGTLRWGLICAVQASRHLGGHVRSVELATVGRRIAENEHDVLDLLGVAPLPDGSQHVVVDHGRPTALELLDAVRGHLEERVAPRLEGSDSFDLRVALNALGIVGRELAAAPPVEPDVDEAALAEAIRSGASLADIDVATVRAAVEARLDVANPRWR